MHVPNRTYKLMQEKKHKAYRIMKIKSAHLPQRTRARHHSRSKVTPSLAHRCGVHNACRSRLLMQHLISDEINVVRHSCSFTRKSSQSQGADVTLVVAVSIIQTLAYTLSSSNLPNTGLSNGKVHWNSNHGICQLPVSASCSSLQLSPKNASISESRFRRSSLRAMKDSKYMYK
jgi:hypothetical protein